MFAKSLTTLLLLASLTGCDQVATLLELPDPVRDAQKAEAEGKAIGAACRQGGRSIEDCFTLHASAHKASVFAGWREMNDYMMQNKMEVVPSSLGSGMAAPPAAAPEAPAEAQAQTAPAEDDRDKRRNRRSSRSDAG